MIPFPTSPEERAQVSAIATEMVRVGLDFEWVAAVTQLARSDQGAYALMSLWRESDSKTKSEIVADLQDTLDEDLIDRHGGISAVARKSGIPQPSLSRMLSSASMPRKSTLYEIAVALGVPESEVVMEWTR